MGRGYRIQATGYRLQEALPTERGPWATAKADSAVRDPGGGLSGPRSVGCCEEIGAPLKPPEAS